jgi:hypothetical protein
MKVATRQMDEIPWPILEKPGGIHISRVEGERGGGESPVPSYQWAAWKLSGMKSEERRPARLHVTHFYKRGGDDLASSLSNHRWRFVNQK